MNRAAKIFCWLCLSLVLLGNGALYRHNPNIVGGQNLILLLPFATTLFALYSKPNRLLIWAGIVINALFASIGLGLIYQGVLGHVGVPWFGLVFGAICIVLSGLNIVALTATLPKLAPQNG